MRDPTTVGTFLTPKVTKHCLALEEIAAVFADICLPSLWEDGLLLPCRTCFSQGQGQGRSRAETVVSIPRRNFNSPDLSCPWNGRQALDQQGAALPVLVQRKCQVCSRVGVICYCSFTSPILTALNPRDLRPQEPATCRALVGT